MDINAAKQEIIGIINGMAPEMEAIATEIFNDPELGYAEFHASARHVDFLRAAGFQVETGILDMPTAYRAMVTKGEGPKVAFLAEFDALPGLGHACGHNLFGTAAAAAGIALARTMESGSVYVFGTPAEEGAVENAGGKIPMAQAGMFDGMDAVITCHAEGRTILRQDLISRAVLEMNFHGKSAHAAGAPEKGINALDAAALAIMGINSLRQHFTRDVRVHGIMSDGGIMVNTIPDFARLRYGVRAEKPATLDDVVARVVNCARCCAEALGCTFDHRFPARTYYTVRHNMSLLKAFAGNLDILGEKYIEHVASSYSTDVGNVSMRCPTIHPYISIGGAHLVGHTPAFAEASRSPEGFMGMKLSACAMAMTGLDVLTSAALRQESRREFESGT